MVRISSLFVAAFRTRHFLYVVPAGSPENVETGILSSTAISVTWDEVLPIDQNGIITGYEVLYEPLETFGGAIGPETVNTTNLFYVLVGLQEYVDYAIFVRAYTRVGFGPYSQRVTNQTFQDSKLHVFLLLLQYKAFPRQLQLLSG